MTICVRCNQKRKTQSFVGQNQRRTKTCHKCRSKKRLAMAHARKSDPEKFRVTCRRHRAKRRTAHATPYPSELRYRQRHATKYKHWHRTACKRYREHHPDRVKTSNARWGTTLDGKLSKILKAAKYTAPGNLTLRQFKKLYLRLKGCCAFCGRYDKLGRPGISIEHLIPQSLGGPTSIKNIVFACWPCNINKHSKDWRLWYRRQSSFSQARYRLICRIVKGS